MDKIKLIIGIGLSLIIIIVLILLIAYRDVAFTNNTTLEYPDGCVEYYVNSKLVSLPCTYNDLNGLGWDGLNNSDGGIVWIN